MEYKITVEEKRTVKVEMYIEAESKDEALKNCKLGRYDQVRDDEYDADYDYDWNNAVIEED